MKIVTTALLLASSLLSACAGNSNTVGPVTCTSIAPPVLLYPAPGATGVPVVANLQLYFGYPSNPGPTFAVPSLTASNGNPTITGTPYGTPSPGPVPPGSLPPPANDQMFVSTISGYVAGTTYTVNVTNAACNAMYSLGSFST